jgi:hypothetical protein
MHFMICRMCTITVLSFFVGLGYIDAFSTSVEPVLTRIWSSQRQQPGHQENRWNLLLSTNNGEKFDQNQEDEEQEEVETVDVIVVGSGVGGLSCAALTAKYGLSTVCVEAHDTPGGVAHSFSRYSSASKTTPFRFDSGPSLITGLSKPSTNPLRQVLDALGTANDIDWKTYDGWLIWDYADGKSIKLTTGDGGEFERAIQEKVGVASRRDFQDFKEKILQDGGLAEVSAYIPPLALRNGNPFLSLVAISRYIWKILTIGTKGLLLTGPFTKTMDLYSVKDPWVRNFFDYLAFALSGVDASNTQGAPIAYMMSDLHRKGAVLDYPMGGKWSL